MNRYRRPLTLIYFVESRPAGAWVARFVGTEMVADLPGGRVLVKYNLVGLSAN